MMVYCAYIDLEHKKSEIFCNGTGEISEINSFRICDCINMSASTICFVPSVKMVKCMYPGGIVDGEEYYKNNDSDILSYKYGKCEFRSFGALIGMQNVKSLQKMYCGMPISVAMYEYLCNLGEPAKIKYTLAYQAKKMFYDDIKEDLWEERKKKKKYYWDEETYWDMYSGVKSGMLSHYYSKYIEDVLMYDIRSAYQSVLINDDKFPIGKIVKIDCKNVDYKIMKIRKYLSTGTWFKVVFDGKFDGFSRYYDTKTGKTGLEYYNFRTIELTHGIEYVIDSLRDKDFRVYYSKENGYINDLVRDKIIELYNRKQNLPKDSFDRYITKTEGESIYGKGIQFYDFKTLGDIQDHYKGRGENYLTPEMSLHCTAKIEYEMAKAVKNTDSEYFDTDGIKVKNTRSAVDYFNAENEIILQRNRDAGYDTDIGTWKFEGKADRMLIFSPKIYIYECNGDITFKAAGVDADYKEYILNSIKGDKIMFMRQHGFPTMTKVYVYDSGDFIQKIAKGKVYGDLSGKEEKRRNRISKMDNEEQQVQRETMRFAE